MNHKIWDTVVESKAYAYIKSHARPIALFLTIAGLLSFPPIWFRYMLSPRQPLGEAVVQFEVESGSTTKQLAEKLMKEGLIKNANVFNAYAKLQGYDVQIKSGNYLVSPSMTSLQIMEKMVSGDVVRDDIRITIPEGSNLEKIGGIFEKYQLISKEEFLQATKTETYKLKYDFLKEFPSGNDLEGVLFPDTYFLPKGKSAEYYIDVLLKQFEAVYIKNEGFKSKLSSTGLDLYETIVLASIVEGEAKLDSEKPIISGVFYNRLKIGMPLQSCVTVEYALKEHKEVLTLKDLEIESPYNTYKYPDLPPGPIGSPGLKSFDAVFNPAEVEFLYFVANGDGSHTFSKTYYEHIKATNRIQGKR